MDVTSSADRARFIRLPTLPGVEALHATFVHHRYAPHIHQALTLAYVTRGAATFELERERYVAPAGRVFVIPPETVHTGEPATSGGYTYHVLYLDADWLNQHSGVDQLGFCWRRSRTVVQNRDFARVLTHAHRALATSRERLEQTEALAIVTELLEAIETSSAAPDRSSAREHGAVGAAREYIHEHWV